MTGYHHPNKKLTFLEFMCSHATRYFLKISFTLLCPVIKNRASHHLWNVAWWKTFLCSLFVNINLYYHGFAQLLPASGQKFPWYMPDIWNYSWNFNIFIYYFMGSLVIRKDVPGKLCWKTLVCTRDQCFPYAIASIAWGIAPAQYLSFWRGP
jgi:hypothetical protein